MHIQTHTRMHLYTCKIHLSHTYTSVCVYVYIYIYTYTYISLDINITHISQYIHIHMYTHMHVYTTGAQVVFWHPVVESPRTAQDLRCSLHALVDGLEGRAEVSCVWFQGILHYVGFISGPKECSCRTRFRKFCHHPEGPDIGP